MIWKRIKGSHNFVKTNLLVLAKFFSPTLVVVANSPDLCQKWLVNTLREHFHLVKKRSTLRFLARQRGHGRDARAALVGRNNGSIAPSVLNTHRHTGVIKL